MAKILLVDDDEKLAQVVVDYLSSTHTIEYVNSGTDALDRLKFYSFDLMILDLGLPGKDGIEVCKRFRGEGGQSPVLMLTGRNSVPQKEEGFDAGADDYLTKPFALKELAMRVRALLRRPASLVQSTIKAGHLELDMTHHKISSDNRELNLLPKEFALLEFLMLHQNTVFSPESLIERVWPSTSDTSPDILRVYVTRLRKKIDKENQHSYIKTVYGVGYKFDVSDITDSDGVTR